MIQEMIQLLAISNAVSRFFATTVVLDPRPLSCVPAMRLTVDAAKNWICAGSWSSNGRLKYVSKQIL